MQYLAWCVLAGLNDTIEMSFLLVGHTKYWCFGLMKQGGVFGRVVEMSAKVNYAQLVGKEIGTTLVWQYDWADYAKYFKCQAFKVNKSYNHLIFSNSKPVVREMIDSTEKKIHPKRPSLVDSLSI